MKRPRSLEDDDLYAAKRLETGIRHLSLRKPRAAAARSPYASTPATQPARAPSSPGARSSSASGQEGTSPEKVRELIIDPKFLKVPQFILDEPEEPPIDDMDDDDDKMHLSD